MSGWTLLECQLAQITAEKHVPEAHKRIDERRVLLNFCLIAVADAWQMVFAGMRHS